MTDISEVATWLSAVDDRSAARDAGTTAFSTNVYSGPRMQKSLRITRLGIGATLLIGLGFPAAAMSPAAPKSKVTANSSGDLSTVLRPGDRQSAEGLSLPRRWSVQLAGSFSKDRALASFVGLRDRHRDALAIGSPSSSTRPTAIAGRARSIESICRPPRERRPSNSAPSFTPMAKAASSSQRPETVRGPRRTM
jgi:hypothetical protein